MEVLDININLIKPCDNNPKKHPEAQIEQLSKSIMRFGFLVPILIDEDNEILAGHGRYIAAKKMGLTTVPCIMASGLTSDQRIAYRVLDNRLAEESEWDMQALKYELSAIDVSLLSQDFPALETLADKLPELDAIDLDEPSPDNGKSKKSALLHCPKCGFAFEV